MTERDASPEEPVARTRSGSGADWLVGGGEMGRMVREKDWSRTPLGPIEEWPHSLRTTVSICLASNFPISIAWGPDRTQIYNDGYWPICGAKHPRSMGQDFKECWESPWPVVGGPFENATAGRTDLVVNERMFLDRHGYLEETFFTFSFSPIRDESGGIGGLFHPVTELTQQTLGERRLRVVRALADRTAELKSIAVSCDAIVDAVAEHELDVPFALLYLLGEDGRRATLVASTGLEPGTAASPATLDLAEPGVSPDGGWPIARAARDRQVLEVDDLGRRFGPFTCGPYPEPPTSAVVLPIHLSGMPHAFGVLVAGVSARRALDEPYRLFYLMLRDSATNALTNAHTYEAERSRAEALAELDRAKTVFFSNISHEFRTPLTLMLGPIAQLRDDPVIASDARVADELEVVHRNGLRLSRLVNTVLDFSRLQAGRMRARFEPVELGAATAELASMFRAATERAGLSLHIECPPLPEPVWVDLDSWEKVVLNLLSNAVKFTFTGSITVAVGPASGGGALLTVIDTGVGIPDADQGRLFERFHQVTGARGRSVEGSGIGLALADELVALHGGTIAVNSRPGVGSTFVVRIPPGHSHLPADQVEQAPTGLDDLQPPSDGLGHGGGHRSAAEPFVAEALRWLPGGRGSAPGEPAQHEPAQHEPARPTGAARPPGSRPPGPADADRAGRVLVADDNTGMREYLRRLLADRHVVTTVTDGAAALASATADPPDLVVSDIMMPGLDGMALLAALRADPATASVPVLLLSARAGQDASVEALAAGADDYLVKPFSAPELLARVDAHLRLNRARRETARAEQRYRAARDVVLALQSSLLPEYLPVVPGMRVAAHYRVAGTEQAAGGDWFDAVPLPDGRVALVAGDVVGHGARASAVMGQLRAVLTAYLLDGYEVADALARLDRFVAGMPDAAATTVCLATLDPLTGRLTYACSGHPPPLLVTADGDARYLPTQRSVPLGTAGDPPAAEEAWLEPGDLILVYTDGLVECPGRTLAAGLEQLRVHAADALLGEPAPAGDAPVDLICRLSLERMAADGYEDDVSVLAAQRVGPVPPPFRTELLASPKVLAGLRRGLGEWLDALGAGELDQEDIQLAVGEAVTNTVDHAYPGGEGVVVVEGYHDAAGRVCMTVSDEGDWRTPPADPAVRGRGLIMIRSCMDTVEVERSEDGTAVLMDRRLRRPPVFAATTDTCPRDPRTHPPDIPYEVRLERSARPRLSVRGSIDASTSDEFRRHIQESSRGGGLPLDLDLTDVVHLASTGVQVLHELAEQMAGDALGLCLIAPPGCPARHVLELTGLDHLIAEQTWVPPAHR
ncbi:MAG TPA: SpoIIE family protein phosphatase [Pseudonocardia sp.]